MNWKAVNEILNSATRLAIILDRDNPRLQKAFPECYEYPGHKGKIPWKRTVTWGIDPKTTSLTEWDDTLKERGIPFVSYYEPDFAKEVGSTDDLILPDDHQIWKKDHGDVVLIDGVGHIVIDVANGVSALTIPLELLDMNA